MTHPAWPWPEAGGRDETLNFALAKASWSLTGLKLMRDCVCSCLHCAEGFLRKPLQLTLQMCENQRAEAATISIRRQRI